VQPLLQAKDRQVEALCARVEVLAAVGRMVQAPILRQQERAPCGRARVAANAPRLDDARWQVPAHWRAKPRRDFTDQARDTPFCDAAQVPVVTIEVHSDEAAALSPHKYAVVGPQGRPTARERPGSYVVLQYRRAVMLGKFCRHLPLYHQHQRLRAQPYGLSSLAKFT
jgi:hypothetical protein